MFTFYSRRNTAGLAVLLMFLLSGLAHYVQGDAAQPGRSEAAASFLASRH